MILSPAYARSFPFGVYIGFLVLESLLSGQESGGASLWLYPVKAGATALVLWWLWRHFTELHRFDLRLPDTALAVLAGVGVFLVWISLDADWMRLGERGTGYVPLDQDGAIRWELVMLRIAGAALVVPLMEELFWRSFLQRWLARQDFLALDPARAGFKALFMASALFAVEHAQWLAGLVAGLAYGGLYMFTRKLWTSVLAHALTNGLLGVYVVATGAWGFW